MPDYDTNYVVANKVLEQRTDRLLKQLQELRAENEKLKAVIVRLTDSAPAIESWRMKS